MGETSEHADSVRRNIPLNYVFTALYNTGFDKGVWMLFLSYRGLGLVQIGLVEAVLQAAMFVFGLPSGVVGDLLGRKVSLVLSVVAKIAAFTLILSSRGILGFAAGFALTAVSQVLYQGASESLTYDSCRIAGLQGGYKQIYGNILAVTFVATALGIAAGGLIAGASFDWVYYASIILLACALVPAAMFAETRDLAKDAPRQSLTRLLSGSMKLITDSPLILYLLVLSACITVVDQTIYMYCQKYFEAMAIPVYLIGLVFCVDSIFAALGARYAYRLERFRNKDVVALIPAVIVVMYVLLALVDAPAVVLLLWTATVCVVGFWPIISELVNARVPSENRTTVLALKAEMSSFGVMLVFPLVGIIASATTLSTAYLWLLATAIPLIAFCIVKIRRIAF